MELFNKFKTHFSKNSYNILVVDDNPFNIEVIKYLFLPFNNFHIFTAINGQIGVDKVNETKEGIFKYDFIFMDLNMPVMNGF